MAPLAKVKLINVETDDEMEALYNPEELDESFKINYGQHRRTTGLKAMQYEDTDRQEFAMTFYLDTEQSDRGGPSIGEFRRFLRSLGYPVQLPNGEVKDPPDVLFVWSNYLCSVCRLTGTVRFRNTRFEPDLRPRIYTAECTLTECGFTLITSEQARNEFVVL